MMMRYLYLVVYPEVRTTNKRTVKSEFKYTSDFLVRLFNCSYFISNESE